MASLSSIARSGMNAAQANLDASAHNVANLGTPGFRRQEVGQTALAEGGVRTSVAASPTEGSSLETDVVTQLQAKNAFLANLRVFKTATELTGTLLDQKA